MIQEIQYKIQESIKIHEFEKMEDFKAKIGGFLSKNGRFLSKTEGF